MVLGYTKCLRMNGCTLTPTSTIPWMSRFVTELASEMLEMGVGGAEKGDTR